jgi:hypothetical protein
LGEGWGEGAKLSGEDREGKYFFCLRARTLTLTLSQKEREESKAGLAMLASAVQKPDSFSQHNASLLQSRSEQIISSF